MTTKIAFLTSGGDSPGMNCAVRAIVRMSLRKGCQPFAILEGFQGLMDDLIVPMQWDDVAFIISEGGTCIKSSRCPQFRERSGRLRAVRNLISRGINNLIVIGGDGSLTGADILRKEWKDLLDELVLMSEVSSNEAKKYENFQVVGLAGSIDNDLFGTELTIGADSSLHRIIEAVDNISSTASSHSRAFIIEVMGRNCGWLALNACVAIGADYMFIPEDPAKDGWEMKMAADVKRKWELRGKRSTIVIVCEGAVDEKNSLIKSSYICKILEDCGLDSRVTQLGHIQRGGSPSAFDRYLATLQGIEAVNAILDFDGQKSVLIGIKENRITRLPLMECVQGNQEIASMMQNLNFKEALSMRGPEFKALHDIVQSFYRLEDSSGGASGSRSSLRLALVNCGAPAGGINAANRAFILYCLFKGYAPIGIFDGFSGLISGNLRELVINDTLSLDKHTGIFLGMNRSLPSENLGMVAHYMQKFDIQALVIIGGYEAFTSQLILTNERERYPAFNVPLIVIPATISNNVPGTEFSIGCDTALNIIVRCADALKQSASSTRKRVFVVDVQGGYCGYLATMGTLAAGGSISYIHEEGIGLDNIRSDVRFLQTCFKNNTHQGRLVLRNEFCSKIYTAELLAKIFESEANGMFDARWATLGHLQQGGRPSPLDRIRATRLAILSIEFIENVLLGFHGGGENSKERSRVPLNSTSVVVGIRGPSVVFTCCQQLEKEADSKHRRPTHQWWMEYRNIIKTLSGL